MIIDKKYFETVTVHKNISGINTKLNDSILSCGFMLKNSKVHNQKDLTFDYYGGLYVLSCTGTYVDSCGKSYKLYPGCFVQRIPGKLHSTFIDDDSIWLEFFICFGKSIFESMSNLGIFDNESPVLHIGKSQKLLENFVTYMDNLRNSQNYDLPYMLLDAQNILYNINLINKTFDKNTNAIISLACKKLRENIKVGANIKSVISMLGIGYESFRKQFKKSMGISPYEYVISERINSAKIMLLDEEMSIKKVSAILGYSDIFAFIKQFKKYTGITPGKFIKMH